MKSFYKISSLLFLILLLIEAPKAKADSASCSGIACNARISKLYINASGQLYIGTTGLETKLNCRPVADAYITLSTKAPGFDAIYASLLAYQLAGDPVNLRIIEGSQSCELAYAVFEKKL